ncbi:MAG: hypothetical protein ABI861_08625 [Panacibacter sp.]
MTESEKTAIVTNAKPVHMLVNKLGLRDTEVFERNKIIKKYKAFIYKNYDGGFRTATVYMYENEYYCNLFNQQQPRERFNRY